MCMENSKESNLGLMTRRVTKVEPSWRAGAGSTGVEGIPRQAEGRAPGFG